jgi:Type IV pilin-like G and H, putative
MTSLFTSGHRKSLFTYFVLSSSAIALLSVNLIACTPTTQAKPTLNPTASPTVNPVIQKLIGQWEIPGVPGKGRNLILIITNDHTVYGWGTETKKGKDEEVLYKLKYSIDPNGKQFRIENDQAVGPDVADLSPLFSTFNRNLFEVTADGHLLLAFGNEENPPNLKDPTVRLKRISDQPTLPSHLTPISLTAVLQSQSIRARESDGQVGIGRLNRAQQAYHLKNKKFATKIADLRLTEDLKTPNYRFAIASTNSQQAVMTATALRPDLKSFTGIVLLTGSGKAATPKAIACATLTASTQPPAVTGTIALPLQCPADSKGVK